MDNTVEQKIKEVLSELGCTECRSFPIDDAYIKAMQRILALFDHYTTTKINEVFTEVIKEAKERLGEGSPMVGVEEVERVFSQKLSQIRKVNDE